MRSWLVNNGIPVAIAIVFALAITAAMNRQGSAPIEVRAPELLPTPTAIIYVHVSGAVAVPGVYALGSGSHVFEAIAAAGGAGEDADQESLNLAAKVADGQKLVVPVRHPAGEPAVAAASAPAPSQPSSSASTQSTAPGATININTASQKMLESLPGIGSVTATKIIGRRDTVGPFARIEQLKDEKIVNASTFERIKARVSAD